MTQIQFSDRNRPLDPPPFPLLSPVESGGEAVDQLLPLRGLSVWRRGTFRRFRGRRREKDPIEDGRRQRRKENDREQGIARGNRIEPDGFVGRSRLRGLEIGLEFRKHKLRHVAFDVQKRDNPEEAAPAPICDFFSTDSAVVASPFGGAQGLELVETAMSRRRRVLT